MSVQKKKTPEVGAADFDLLRNVYIFKQCDGFQQKTANLSYICHDIQILSVRFRV